MDSVTIHRVTLTELELLRQIGRDTFAETFAAQNTPQDMEAYLSHAFSKEQLQKELSNPASEFYFARQGKEEIGYLKVNVAEAQNEYQQENALEIERIYVKREFQGRKIGQLLFEKGIALARKKHVDFVWLGVWEENSKAIQFYEKNGFKAFDRHSFMLGSDEQTDILMKFSLT